MTFSKKIFITVVMIFGLNFSFVSADESAELIVEGESILTRTKAPSHMENIDEIRSGWHLDTISCIATMSCGYCMIGLPNQEKL